MAEVTAQTTAEAPTPDELLAMSQSELRELRSRLSEADFELLRQTTWRRLTVIRNRARRQRRERAEEEGLGIVEWPSLSGLEPPAHFLRPDGDLTPIRPTKPETGEEVDPLTLEGVERTDDPNFPFKAKLGGFLPKLARRES